MISRVTWPNLPEAVRTAIQAHTGMIREVEPAGSGLNSALAATLHTDTGPVFIKGIPTDHPQSRTQQREAAVNPYVQPVAPRLLWRVTEAGWDILAFEHIAGRPADLSPGSPDLPRVANALTLLHTLACPELPLRRIEDRWAAHLPAQGAHLLHGDHLLHTDLNPHNILIAGGKAKIVDWAWPTRGANWIDAACLALWLIHAGHTPRDAETWIGRLPSCAELSTPALNAFVTATARLWAGIAEYEPSAWKRGLAATTHCWYDHRLRRRG